jgi:hypothetical protein
MVDSSFCAVRYIREGRKSGLLSPNLLVSCASDHRELS